METDEFEVERGNVRSRLVFRGPDTIRQFVLNEQQGWAWISDNTRSAHAAVKNVIAHYKPQWTQNIISLIDRWTAGEAEAKEQIYQALRTRFSKQKSLCYQDTEAQALGRIGAVNPKIASVALAVVHGAVLPTIEQGFIADEENRTGFAKGNAILAGIDPSVVDGARAAFEANYHDSIKLTQEQQQLLDRSEASAKQNANSILAAADEQRQDLAGRHELLHDDWKKQFDAIKEALEATTRAYEVRMELQGPVRYWQKKAELHRRSARIARWSLIFYSVAATIILYCLFEQAASHLPANATNIPYAALFKSTAFALLMTTVAFWIGRIILRIFLSDRHLATDAEERRTMIMTFLALTNKNAVKEDDRNLVLTAIFRAGSDGIVSDEAAPDTAFATLIGALLKRP